MGRFREFKLSRERGSRGFYDPETGREYSRCAVSLVGPSAEKPGFVICCGEELTIRPPQPVFCLDELESPDFHDLLSRAADFRNEFDAGVLLASLDDREEVYLSLFNEEARKRLSARRPLYFDRPANLKADGRIDDALLSLRKVLRPARKLLHLGAKTVLGARLQELPVSTFGIKAKDYPAAAAIALLISHLSVWSWSWNPPDEGRAKTDYDPLECLEEKPPTWDYDPWRQFKRGL